eukprot:4917810-Amphidinium_carterae.1
MESWDGTCHKCLLLAPRGLPEDVWSNAGTLGIASLSSGTSEVDKRGELLILRNSSREGSQAQARAQRLSQFLARTSFD